MELRSGMYGGKNRNQHLASRMALAAAAFFYVERLYEMYHSSCWEFRHYGLSTSAGKITPSMAPLIANCQKILRSSWPLYQSAKEPDRRIGAEGHGSTAW